jgi:hypothetical protein
MSIQSNFPNLKPSLLLDFANTKQLDNRVTFTRSTPAVYYDGETTAMAEQNTVLYSQDIANAYWVKNQVSLTSATAPDGTSTASTLTEALTNANHAIWTVSGPIVTNTDISSTFSIYAKAGTCSTFAIQIYRTGGAFFIDFDLTTVASSVRSGTGTSSITAVGGGWYRCTATSSALGSNTWQFEVYMSLTYGGSVGYLGTGRTLSLWGVQAEQRSTATAYTVTTTQPITNYIPVLLSAGGNQARFDHNPTTGESLGLLIEEQRTNMVFRSVYAGANWTFYGTGSLTQNYTISPDASQTACRIVSTGFQTTRIDTGAVVGGTTYAASIWMKSNTSSNQTIALQIGDIQVQSCTVTPQWQRFVGASPPAGSGYNFIDLEGTAVDISAWGAQLEQASFATSYIPTTGAAATRTADLASMTGTNFSSWYSQGNGTFYAEASTASVAGDVMIAEATNSAGAILDFSLTFATTSTQFINRFVASNNDMRRSGVVAANTMVKFSGAITNSPGTTLASANGVAMTSTGNQTLIIGADRMFIGSRNGSSLFLNAPIRKLAFYPAQLTQTQQNSITG